VKRAHQILVDAGIDAQLHPNGTNVEGELADIFDAIRRVHETLHTEGTVRPGTFAKIGTRTDNDASLAAKML
jgi:uncharacterized protein (TIGR00106 family)